MSPFVGTTIHSMRPRVPQYLDALDVSLWVSDTKFLTNETERNDGFFGC